MANTMEVPSIIITVKEGICCCQSIWSTQRVGVGCSGARIVKGVIEG